MTPAQLTLVTPGAPVAERVPVGERNRYFDLLRVLAIVQVMVVHVVPFAWYPATFPAVGIILAIDASLLAGSLDRSRHRAFPVIKGRVLRLLAPLWVVGAILVPSMIAFGWTNTGAGQPLEATSLLKWVVPISPPPASDLGHDLALPFWLWALSCYLCLLLLSPVLLWLFRRWPKRTLAVPLTVLCLNAAGLVSLTGDVGEVAIDVAAFGTCWLLGFAHHDGVLTRIRLSVALVAGVTLYGIGVVSAYAFAPPENGPAPERSPLAYGLLSIGLVLVLLRLQPLVRGRLGAHRFLTGLLIAVNRRALTIYLWGNASLSVALYLIQVASQQTWWPALPAFAWPIFTLALATVPLLVCAVCFGWVQDKSAGRPVRLNPWPVADATEHSSGHHEAVGAADQPRRAQSPGEARARGRHLRQPRPRVTSPRLRRRSPSA